MSYKTGIGHYTYGNTKPHAVTSIENTDCLMALSRLDTEYNEFGKIARIHDSETNRSMDFLYGPDDERYCSIQRYNDGSIEHEVIYLDGLDLWIDWDGYQKWTYYPEDHVITRKTGNSNFNHYFTFTDQVGSILKVVDANGTVKFSATYDPWGRQTVTTNQIGLIRGYTGHEMLTEYGLINMNGRLYDPLLGRFLSTDNFVQEPGSTQSFNRYSYCLNNPLKYNDPSGEIWWMPILANICFSAAESYGNHEGVWQGALRGMATSAISMATSYATMGIGNLFSHSLGSAGTELLRAGTHGLLNGAVNSIEGKSFGAGFASGAIASLAASGAEALGAGYGGMLASSVVGGSIGSGLMGGSWVNGTFTGMNIAMYNHGWKYIDGEWVYELEEVEVKPLHAMLASYKPMEPGLQTVSPEFDLLFGGGGLIGMVKNIFSFSVKQSTQRLTRQEIRNWLGNVYQKSPSQLRSDLETVGFKRAHPASEHYKHRDITIRLDQPDAHTSYNHMHIEVGSKSNKSYYDINLEKVNRRSPNAHIRIR